MALNINKLFPRFTIGAKLATAFAGLALAPLVIVAAIVIHTTVQHLRATAAATLRHDVERAQAQTEQAVRGLEQDAHYLADAVLGPLLSGGQRPGGQEVDRDVTFFLSLHPALYQVKLVDRNGLVHFVGRGGSSGPPGLDQESEDGAYYAWRARPLEAEQHLLFPVELRGDGKAGNTARIPAVAVLVPVMDNEGELLGAVVVEARASALFSSIEIASPNLPGVTGVTDATGRLLYHSERKRDWASLLATQGEAGLLTDFPADVAAALLSGRNGTLRIPGGRIVSFAPLSLDNPAIGRLILYRVVPLSAIQAQVRHYLSWVTAVGVLTVLGVLALAILAARQFTRPIYRLRRAASDLARGAPPAPLSIETNDELEDLAAEFSSMAATIDQHRRGLENLVAARTRQLAEKHAELEGLLAHSADAIIGVDAENRVRVWNRGAEELFGYTAEEAFGQDPDALLGRPGSAAAREATFIRAELAARGALVNFQTNRRTREGGSLPVSLTQTLIRGQDGQVLGASLILRDTSAQAKLEERMRQSERVAAASVMAAGLAHELNNPLAVVANRIECMQREIGDTCGVCPVDDDLRVLHEHTARLILLTRELLHFGGNADEEPGPMALGAAVDRVVTLLERPFAARGLHLETRAPPEVPAVIATQSGLETVCLNLLLNAADATPPGGSVEIAVSAPAGGDWVELAVTDTGPGVPPELRGRIFEPFFTTKGPRGGTGLGLAVCRSIVERHHGRIWLETEQEQGARFVVMLPAGGRGGAMEPARILIVDDEPAMLENCERLLSREGYACRTLVESTRFREAFGEVRPDVVLVDLRMPGADGFTVLAAALADDPVVAVIVITAYASVDSAVRAVREGAFDYLSKPFSADQLLVAVERAVRYRGLTAENRALQEQVARGDASAGIVAASPAMVRLLEQAKKVAPTEANVLLTGESGTGKELIARQIHAWSARRSKRFVPVDCAALPEGLLESELFGYERGAFTGATGRQNGLLLEANGGTVFLDEFTELGLPLQSKLLRTIEQREVRRLGSAALVELDVRVVAATNIDLEAAVSAGTFRQDLYYRLNVVRLAVPPLRARRGDIVLLAHHFLDHFAADHGREPPRVSADAWALLEAYDWPGNVRELKNVAQRLVVLDADGRVTPSDLPEPIRFPLAAGIPSESRSAELEYDRARADAIRSFHASYLKRLLEQHGGNVSHAARTAGVNRRTLHRWLAELRAGEPPEA